MLYVKKANKVLQVSEFEKDSFLQKGFDVIDAKTGKVITEATGGRTYTPAEISALKKEIDKLETENAKLKKDIKKLKAKGDAENGKTKETDSAEAKAK